MKICSVCDRCFEASLDECPDHGELREGPHSVDIVAGYLIERVIASSPNAVIYQARNIEYGQECVVSIAESRQFVSDAKIAAGLFNAGVAGVIESGELADGSGFAVFEGFTGTSLRDVLSDETLSLLDRIRIARQAAEAVHAIHLAGLNHGAIRPENVSINGLGTEELTVKVHNIDLGSAFATGVLSNRFAMDSSLELLRYIAPERFRGEPSTVQSDVYSLGLLLYEILSGHPPFEATSAAALTDMHLNQKPPEIKIENFDLRMLLTHTIYEALQKQPSFRQSTADLFARQMRHIEQLATHVSTPPPAVAIAAAAATSPVRAQVQIPFTAKAVAPPEIRPEPLLPVAVMVETSPPIEQTAPVLTHSVAVEDALPFAQSEPRRSRLKGMKKRVHSHISNARAALSSTPTLIEWNQPAEDIPSVEAVREELTRSGEPPSFDADEEITHVRGVERIEVDWSEPVRTTPGIAAEFLPTIASKPSVESASMFAGYHSQGRGVGRLPVYAVGAFAMILIGFGFFRLASALSGESDAYVGEYRPTPVQVPAPVKQAEPVEQPVTVAQPISLPAAIEQPEVDETVKAKIDAPQPIKAVPVVSKEPAKEPPRSTAEARASEPAPIIVGQSASRATPIVPSTLVITRGDRTRSAVVAGASSHKPKVIVVGSGATRPRIVSLPN